MEVIDKYTLYHRLYDGWKKINADHIEEENQKLGILRGGTSGCMTEDGRIIGKDPREAVLRFFGIQYPTTYDNNLMMQLGNLNEEGWAQLLEASGTEFLREENVPMVTKITSYSGKEYDLTGRPDVVLTKEGVPYMGVELKQLCSFHETMKRANFIDNSPKTEHIVQAGVYSSHFGIPWVLAYTSRVNWPVPYGNPSKANPEGRWTIPDHRALKKDDKGRVYTIEPFMSFYDLTWDGDVLFVDGIKTVVTGEGIKRWYSYVVNCIEKKEIPMKRGGYWTYDGHSIDEKDNTSIKYDKFSEARTTDFDTWLVDCKNISNNKFI